MKTLILSVMLALQSFAFENIMMVDSTQIPSPEQIAECQQDARLYETNLDLLTKSGVMSRDLQKLSTSVQKSYGNFSLNCYYLSAFNTKAKEVIEKNR